MERKKVEEFIAGPISLSEHYSKKHNKHVYIFGDIHYMRSNCKGGTQSSKVTLEKFLSKTFKENKDKIIDFFLEEDFVSKEKKVPIEGREGTTNYMEKVHDFFGECFQMNKKCFENKKSQYSNVRFHYADIRLYPNVIGYFYSSLRNLGDLGSKLMDYEEIEKEQEGELDVMISDIETIVINIEDKYANIIKMSNDELKKFIMDEMWKVKIGKQLSGVTDKSVKEALLSFYESCQNNFNFPSQELKDNPDMVKEPLKKFFKQISKLASKISDLLIEREEIEELNKELKKLYLRTTILEDKLLIHMMCVMDVYLLSRMFRKFRDIPGRYSEEPKYVIIYVGDAHADNYRKFLSSIGFDLINSVEDIDQCIDISGFQRPFFSSPDVNLSATGAASKK